MARPVAPVRRIDFPSGGDGRVPASRATLRFVGNATLLLQFGGLTLLTDPNFLHAGDHAHIGYGMRTKRLREPGMQWDELPPVDAVVLSHYHGDHFDHEVEARLRRDVPIVTNRQAAAILRRHGFRAVTALRYWSSVVLRRDDAEVTVTALPARHGPGITALALPQVMGSLVEARASAHERPLRIYISRDTVVHRALREIPRRFPEIDVAVLHLGGTRVFGLLVTLDGAGGVRALQIVDARVAIPVHVDDYDIFTSPLDDFTEAVIAAGLDDRVRYVARGETIDLRAL